MKVVQILNSWTCWIVKRTRTLNVSYVSCCAAADSNIPVYIDLKSVVFYSNPFEYKPPGGYLIYFLTGCAARGLKPLPISKDFSCSKNGWIDTVFFRNFRKSRPISKGFSASKPAADFTNFSEILWNGTLKGFSWPKWDPCLRIFGEKSNPFGRHIPVCLNMWVPPWGISQVSG